MDLTKRYLLLEDEFQQLVNKIQKLEEFIESDKYLSLSQTQQSLLFVQKEAMKTYGSCLVARMKDIQEESLDESRT